MGTTGRNQSGELERQVCGHCKHYVPLGCEDSGVGTASGDGTNWHYKTGRCALPVVTGCPTGERIPSWSGCHRFKKLGVQALRERDAELIVPPEGAENVAIEYHDDGPDKQGYRRFTLYWEEVCSPRENRRRAQVYWSADWKAESRGAKVVSRKPW
jgi:hypothetical protein